MENPLKSFICPFAAVLVSFFGALEPALARVAFVDFAERVKGSSTLSESLRLLPKEYRENYTLMRDSLSIQQARELAPRVISFGTTGETIYTFNGNPDQGGYPAMEVADFDNKTMRLNFYEVIFKSETDLPDALKKANQLSAEELETYFDLKDGEVKFQNRNVIVTRGNPGKCMNCHGADVKIDGQTFQVAKYLWGPYRGWKGAYGEFHDVVGTNSDGKDPQLVLASYLKFKNEVRPSHPRYAFLDPGHTEAFPFTAFSPFPPQEKIHNITSEPSRFSTSPNLRLTFMVAANYARMMSQIFFESRTFRSDVRGHLRNMFCDNQELHRYFDFFLDIQPLTEYREKQLNLDYWASQDDLLFLESDIEKLVRTHVAYLSRIVVPEISLPTFPLKETLQENNMIGANHESVRFLIETGKFDLRMSHPLKINSPSPKDLVEAVCKSLR